MMSAKKSRSVKRKVIAEVRALLHERFPYAFVGKNDTKRPLRIGVDVDVMRACPDLPRWKINLAITDYCTGPRYWKCTVEGVQRIGLDGYLYEPVTAGAADFSARRLVAWQAARDASRNKRRDEWIPPLPPIEAAERTDLGHPVGDEFPNGYDEGGGP